MYIYIYLSIYLSNYLSRMIMDCEGKPGETAGPAALTREILGEPKN